MEKIIKFITDSAKRNERLQHAVRKKADNSSDHLCPNKKKQLIKLCRTRFAERHVEVDRFWEKLTAIASALEIMTTWKDANASSNATLQLNSLLKTEFLVGVRTLKCIAATLRPLSLALQEKGLDLTAALVMVDSVVSILSEDRENANEKFRVLYSEVTNMADMLGFEAKMPRVVSSSRYRANAEQKGDAESYYRVNVFIPAVDAVLQDIKDRFSVHQRSAYALGFLLPSRVKTATWESVKPAYEKYKGVISYNVSDVSEEQVKAEFRVWASMCRMKEDSTTSSSTSSAIEALNSCPADSLPTVHTMLNILATLPVCSAEAERTFSKVEKTLTALRSTMTEDRLDALLMLQAHREMLPDNESVISYFVSGAHRRMDLKLD